MISDDFQKSWFFNDFTRFRHLHHLEESASHPLPLLEGVPQVQTQEDISVSGKIAGNIKVKLCGDRGRFIIHISGLVNSFGPASCLAQDIISLHQWIAAGSSRKSI